MGMTVPRAHGGPGRGFVDAVPVIEEMAESCTVTARIVVEANMGAISTVMAYGSEAQKKLAAGWCWPATSRRSASPSPTPAATPLAMTTRADSRGDGYVLNGKKHWITGAGVSRLHLIFARVFDEHGAGARHRRLPRGARRSQGRPGRVARREHTMGLRGMPEGDHPFENLEVAADMVLLPPSGFRRGFADLMNAYNSQRVGAATVAHRHRRRRPRPRPRLGEDARAVRPPDRRVPGPAMDARRHGDRRSSRPRLVLRAAASRGPDGSPFPDPTLAAQAKVFASDTALKVANDALQMFGARGYSRDLPLERMVRDVRMFTIAGGTAQILRTQVAAAVLGMKLPQTRHGYLPKPPDARRRGVIMHPIFASAGEARAVPILFVNAATFERRPEVDEREHVFVRAAGFEPKPGQYLALPGEGGLSGVLFGLEDARRREGSVPARPAAARCCRRASTVSPTLRTTRGSRRSLSRSAPIALRATASPRPQGAARCCRDGLDGEDLSASSKA